MPTPFRTTRRVEFADTDMAGIVHFANFFRYMESAEVEFLRSRGLSVKLEWEGRKLGLPRVAAACDFLRPARFEDILEITVTLTNVGRKSVSYNFDFFKDGERIARGQVTAVCCLVGADQKIESVEIPETLRKRLEHEA
jgi:YbgC/YbaW family acyl-CoA thioester hydrolase